VEVKTLAEVWESFTGNRRAEGEKTDLEAWRGAGWQPACEFD